MALLSAVWNWLAHTVDWGNAQELITWIVAAAALWFARKAAIAARATNEQQARQIANLEADQRQREESERRQQASSVAIWYFRDNRKDYAVRISNTSNLPILNVVVSFGGRVHWPPFDVVTPKLEVRETVLDVTLTNEIPKLHLDENSRLRSDDLVVSFTDITGNRWSRNVAGALVELHSEQDTKFHDCPLT